MAEPRQCNSVETAVEVLKPPGPEITMAWVEPISQGSISRGACPPRPQVFGSEGMNLPRDFLS